MHSLSFPGHRKFQLNDVKKMVEYPVEKEIISDTFLLVMLSRENIKYIFSVYI